jgi:uncharacterized Zn finger protein
MSTDPKLRAYVDGMSREALAALLLDLAGRIPAVADALAARRRPVAGEAGKIAAGILGELKFSRRSGPWPDFESIQERLAQLRDAGAADAMLELAAPIIEAGADLIEETEDEGDLAEEVAACLDLVFDALPQSSPPPHERILWAIDMELRDPYDLARGSAAVWDYPEPAAWSQVADALRARLERLPAGSTDDYSARYARDGVMDRLRIALEKAGRADETIALLIEEARRAGSYPRLVKALRAAGRAAEAEQWARTGLATALDSGSAAALRQAIAELRAEASDWHAVAALQADAFFSAPSLHMLQRLLADSARAGVEPAVRAAALRYLEDGVRPDAAAGWPLPPADPPLPPGAPQRFPQYDALIQLASDEQRPDDVLRWYDRARAEKARLNVTDDVVAAAVASAYPERAAQIWRELAEQQLKHADVRAYDVAACYLGRLRAVVPEPEWRAELEGLKATYRRRPRLVEAIDKVLREP